MVNKFLKFFNEVFKMKFKTKTPDGKEVRFFKSYIDEGVFAVYAVVMDDTVDENDDVIFYDIIGIGDENDSDHAIFFINDMSKKIFTPQELEKLQKMSSSPLRTFDDIKTCFREAMDDTVPEKYIYKFPYADITKDVRDSLANDSADKFAFSENPGKDIMQDVMDTINDYSRGIEYNKKRAINMSAVRGSWAHIIVKLFLVSVFHPKFPYFYLKEEKNKYIKNILKCIEKRKEDPTSLAFRYRTIPDAVRDHNTVTIDFLDSKKRPRTITVKSAAFENINVLSDRGKRNIYMPITDEVSDTDTLLTLDAAFPDCAEKYYPRNWFSWGSILCIRSENQILWHFSEALTGQEDEYDDSDDDDEIDEYDDIDDDDDYDDEDDDIDSEYDDNFDF